MDLSVETYPKDSVTDPKAYLEAIAAFLPGDAVTIFTPDDTHFEIALAAIQRGEYVESSSSSLWTVLIDPRLMSLASIKMFRTELLELSVQSILLFYKHSADILLSRSPRDDHKTCREDA